MPAAIVQHLYYSKPYAFHRLHSLAPQGYSEPESARLDLQHQIFIHALGGALSPRAKEAVKTSRIKTVLELATGTGSWVSSALNEIRQLAPPGQSVSIVATDVTQYETWPAAEQAAGGAITFLADVDILDNTVLASLKRVYTNDRGFDLVHFRHIAIFVPAEKWEGLMDSVISLVAPGGLLQHEAFDTHHNAHTVAPPLSTFFMEFTLPMLAHMGKMPESSSLFADWCVQRRMGPVDSHTAPAYGRHSGLKVGADFEQGERTTALIRQNVQVMTANWVTFAVAKLGLEREEAQRRVDELRESLDADTHEFDDRIFAKMVVAQKTGLSKDLF